jgi:hypothetical protein
MRTAFHIKKHQERAALEITTLRGKRSLIRSQWETSHIYITH